MRVLALALALALAAGAGCVGKDKEGGGNVPQALQQLAGPSADELARTPGTIGGIVHTAALEPVVNATIEAPRLSLRATTDAAGTFRLDGLATGEHLLSISAVGFVTRSVTVQAQNGTTLQVDVVLERAPSVEPYAQTRELQGFLSCSALVAGEARDCASADPNHRDEFEFELASGGRNAVLELSWDASATPAAQEMTLFVETVGYGAQDIDLGNATGVGYARVEVPQPIMEKYYPEGGLMRARIALAPGDAPVSAAAQVSFTVYATVFYHGAAPAGYTVIS
ncbi:MAG TPA: carboxypeptidase regulatory-like domain-containing protein [Candidatus Thermoplasmatota archaeon]|nr:carboxypeptidase regulatory-like domain-containing protein [Candidatus Thermoplasmatota archaeon]